MNSNQFKNISIGTLIHEKVLKIEIDITRICKFLKCTEEEVEQMYTLKSIDSSILLRWSKLLEYDFFRLYSQHILFYVPEIDSHNKTQSEGKKSKLPEFRKTIYTQETIDFITQLIESGKRTQAQITKQYKIPKSTLYRWIKKNKAQLDLKINE